MNYRIREEIFEDGRSEFIPEMESEIESLTYFPITEWKHQINQPIRRDSFDEALLELNKFRYFTPKTVKFHEID